MDSYLQQRSQLTITVIIVFAWLGISLSILILAHLSMPDHSSSIRGRPNISIAGYNETGSRSRGYW